LYFLKQLKKVIDSLNNNFQSLIINSYKNGSIIVDSSLKINQALSAATIQNNLISSAKTTNLLDIDTSSISITPLSTPSSDNDNNNNQWWLPLAIILPIFSVIIPLIAFYGYKYYKKVIFNNYFVK
jgi:hypothetical protein